MNFFRSKILTDLNFLLIITSALCKMCCMTYRFTTEVVFFFFLRKALFGGFYLFIYFGPHFLIVLLNYEQRRDIDHTSKAFSMPQSHSLVIQHLFKKKKKIQSSY